MKSTLNNVRKLNQITWNLPEGETAWTGYRFIWTFWRWGKKWTFFFFSCRKTSQEFTLICKSCFSSHFIDAVRQICWRFYPCSVSFPEIQPAKMKQVKMNFLCALPRPVQGGPEEYFRKMCHSKALHSQGMWILCSCVCCWTQKAISTQLKLSFSDLASHCVSVQPQELLLHLFLVKQDCWKCFQASSWDSAYPSLEMSSSSLIADICIPVPQISLCQALQNWSSALLKFVEVLYLCFW